MINVPEINAVPELIALTQVLALIVELIDQQPLYADRSLNLGHARPQTDAWHSYLLIFALPSLCSLGMNQA